MITITYHQCRLNFGLWKSIYILVYIFHRQLPNTSHMDHQRTYIRHDTLKRTQYVQNTASAKWCGICQSRILKKLWVVKVVSCEYVCVKIPCDSHHKDLDETCVLFHRGYKILTSYENVRTKGFGEMLIRNDLFP